MRLIPLTLLSLFCTVSSLAGETTVALNRSGVAASLDTQRITVPAGERVVLSIPVLSGNVWFKDGSPLLGANGRVFIIESAQVEDSGLYKVDYVGGANNNSQELELTVVPTSARTASSRLLTFSTRGIAGSGDSALVAGFVVGGSGENTSESKRVLIRAVGPTLEEFGLDAALQKPVLNVYDQSGVACEPLATSDVDLAKAQLASGAYPLKQGMGDVSLILRLKPGVYTAQVSSGGEPAGYVMLEVYDLP